jgi:hypothetical protein
MTHTVSSSSYWCKTLGLQKRLGTEFEADRVAGNRQESHFCRPLHCKGKHDGTVPPDLKTFPILYLIKEVLLLGTGSRAVRKEKKAESLVLLHHYPNQTIYFGRSQLQI